MLIKIDEERVKWSLFLYGVDTRSADLYDIILHINNLKVDDAVDIIYNYAQRPCFEVTTSTIEKIKDMSIAATAYSIIVDKFPDANVKCKNGILVVSLESPMAAEKKLSKKFEKLLGNIEGVNEVRTFVIPVDT